MFISEKHKFIFIHIPKTAGSTVDKRLSLQGIINDDSAKCFVWDYITKKKGCFDKKQNTIIQPYHLSYKDIGFSKEQKNKFFTFSFVRNPYDRFYSSILYSRNNFIKFIWLPALLILIFAIFCKVILKWNRVFNIVSVALLISISIILYLNSMFLGIFLPVDIIIKYFKPQLWKNTSSLLKPQYQFLEPLEEIDFIGKQETFEEDFQYISEKIGISSCPFINDNTSSNNTPGLFEYANRMNKKTRTFIENFYKDDFRIFNYPFYQPVETT